MTTDPQPRDQNTGQYGRKTHSFPEVPLAEEVDGSFLFPPSEWPGGAEQYLHFWKTQPISDEALTNFASAYAAEWDDWGQPKLAAHMYTWGNGEEARQARLRNPSADELDAIRNAEAERYVNEDLARYRLRRIPTSVVRHVARAAQIIHNVDRLPEDQRNIARGAPMYRGATGDEFTAQELWDRFVLNEIMPDAFYSRENAVQTEIRELRESLRPA